MSISKSGGKEMEVEVVFQPEGKRVKCLSQITLLEAAKAAGVDITAVCGGLGRCGKCRVIIEAGRESLDPPTEAERGLLSETDLSTGYRLACQVFVRKNILAKIPEESRTGRQRLLVEGIEVPVKADQCVKKYFVEVPKPNLFDLRSDAERLLDALGEKYGLSNLIIEPFVLQSLPLILRDADWKVTVVIWDDRVIIDVEPGDTTKRLFGCAFDVGTTKIAGYLLDLNSGLVLAVDSMINPQVVYGEDVISRISYASKGARELKDLQVAVISGINKILRNLADKTGVRLNEIYEMTVVGNTAMHHIFLGINPKYVSLAPYTPAVRKSINVKSREINIEINSNGNVHVLPVVGGFVGADTVAVILATKLYEKDDICMAIDVGTNTEGVLGNKEVLLATSCASGPAFEGAHIKHGMRAASGAIEKIRISPETLEVEYKTIDDASPRGICGSAVIDAIAEMLKAGIIDAYGAFNREIKSPRLRSAENGVEFIIAWGHETAIGKDIVITQKDIREIQLAKAAIHAGCMILMEKIGITESDISMLFLAGAFGTYINPESARIIGMYPEIPLNKVRAVGNAAGTGARICLVSKSMRRRAEDLHRIVKYVELSAEPAFQTEFLKSHFLPYADFSRYPETINMLRKLGREIKRPPQIFFGGKLERN
ncbi:MAG: ASKHA domain-containing protein [Candidatus Bathyarchaeia archaeon]